MGLENWRGVQRKPFSRYQTFEFLGVLSALHQFQAFCTHWYIVLRNMLVQLDKTQGNKEKTEERSRPVLPSASLARPQRQRTHCNTGSSFPFSPSFSFSSQCVCPCYPELLSLRTGLQEIWALFTYSVIVVYWIACEVKFDRRGKLL